MAGVRNRRRLLILAALVGIGIRAADLAKVSRADLCGADFPVFYAGGMLVGTPDLYSARAVQNIQVREMGCSSTSAVFIRLPYFAAFMKPWSWLPFWSAFALWRAAGLAAVAIFIWLWPAPREWTLLACAWSLPIAYSFTNGQDVGFLLMWLAIAAALLKRGGCFSAGPALAMCAAKFHLFVLLPILLEARLKKVAHAFALGAVALTIVSFAAGGMGWPTQFAAAITHSPIDPSPQRLFNARGIAHGSVPVLAAIVLLVVAIAVYVFRHGDLWHRFAMVLTGGLLLSFHNTISDMALLIPVALILCLYGRSLVTKMVAVFLASPTAYVLVTLPQFADVPRLLLLVLAGLLAWEVRPLYEHPQGRPLGCGPTSERV